MPGHQEWVQRAQPRAQVEIVDREEFTLLDAPLAERDPWGPKEYLIRRGGQAALAVHARDKGFYYIHSPLDSDRNHMGYVQHSRRGALLAGALLLTRGIPPPRPEVGEVNLRRLVANRPGVYSYSVPGARLGRPGSRSPQSQRPLKAGWPTKAKPQWGRSIAASGSALMASYYAQLDRCLEAFHVKGAVGAGPPDLVQVICMMAEIEELRADASRLLECLLAMSAAQVGDGSFRTAAHDVATTDVTADRLRERFS